MGVDKMQKINQESKAIRLGDSIKIVGEVEIRNGDTVIKAKNRFVQTMLQHICNMMSLANINSGPGVTGIQGPMQPPLYTHMYLGTDTTTPTVYNATALASPIGAPPGTAENIFIGSTSNPSNGVFQITMSATWNAGTVIGTVGELALYLLVLPAGNLRAFQWTTSLNPLGGGVLASRLSVADGSFPAFVIDNTKPLAVTWTLKVSF